MHQNTNLVFVFFFGLLIVSLLLLLYIQCIEIYNMSRRNRIDYHNMVAKMENGSLLMKREHSDLHV